jgi:hypothetical protein
MNSLSNGKITTEKVNLVQLAELAIHQTRIDREEIDMYDTPPVCCYYYLPWKGVILSLTPRQQLIYTSAVFYDCTVLRVLFTTALGLLKPNTRSNW